MPASSEPNRRFTIALTAAVAATTVAIGVTAATLLGWFRPVSPPQQATSPPAAPSVVYVPIAPATAVEPPAPAAAEPVQLAIDQPREREHEREHEREDDDD